MQVQKIVEFYKCIYLVGDYFIIDYAFFKFVSLTTRFADNFQ